MSCEPSAHSPRCDITLDQMDEAIAALLPRGPAWQTDEMAGSPGDSALRRYWRAVARVFVDLNERLCALLQEAFCARLTESRAEWLLEYGLPDDCDPAGDDLCFKVAMEGGATSVYLTETARRLGWNIEVYDPAPRARFPTEEGTLPDSLPYPLALGEPLLEGLLPGVTFDRPINVPWGMSADAALAGCAEAGCAQVGCETGCGADRRARMAMSMALAPWAYTFRVRVLSRELGHLNDLMADAGCGSAGCSLVGYRPYPEALACVLDRIKPAHTRIIYEIDGRA